MARGGDTAIFLIVLLVSSLRASGMIDFMLAVAFAALLYALRVGQIGLPRFLEPLARYGRESSYSLYVVHFPLLALIGSLVSGGVRMAPSPIGVAMVLALTLVCVGLGCAFSELTERNTGKARAFLRRRFG